MAALPSGITYCKFVGRYAQAGADSPVDLDSFPDRIPMTGNVTATPRMTSVDVADGSSGVVTIFPTVIIGNLVNGVITGVDGNEGFYVVAGDMSSVQAFSYLISYNFTGFKTPITFDVLAPGGTTVNLNTAVHVNPVTLQPSTAAESAWWVEAAAIRTLIASLPGGGSSLVIDDSTASTTKVWSSNKTNTAVAAKYTKPGSGIPSTDFTSAVTTSLGRADTAVQSSAMTGKADLVSGKVPLSQLPSDIGTPGKSAYQTWLDAGNTGTESQFLASLQGASGTSADALVYRQSTSDGTYPTTPTPTRIYVGSTPPDPATVPASALFLVG